MVRGVANYQFYTLVDAYIEATSILRSQSVVPGASRSATPRASAHATSGEFGTGPGRFGHLERMLYALGELLTPRVRFCECGVKRGVNDRASRLNPFTPLFTP